MNIQNLITVLVFSGLSFTAWAGADGDLVLPAERWKSVHSGYMCNAYEAASDVPPTYKQLNLQFETVTTDRTLDNGLIKASFEQDGAICRYNAFLFADNDASTIQLVESKVYAVEGDSTCSLGKELLDRQLQEVNPYLYWGHPHHLTIMVNDESAESVCGTGATRIGIDFTVTGRVDN